MTVFDALETIWQIRKVVEDVPGRAMFADLPAAVQAIKDERNALLDQWNSIVQASGSRTHGGAVGVVAETRRENANLRALLSRALVVIDNRADAACVKADIRRVLG